MNYVAVDRLNCDVGDSVLVTWELQSWPLHERDFIGMFEVEEDVNGDHMDMPRCHGTMDRLIDSRLRGDTSISGGLIKWSMREDLFLTSMSPFMIDVCFL